MIYRIRLILTILAVEIALGIMWWNMVQPASLAASSDPAKRLAVSGEIMGSAMGAVLGFGILLYFVARANDRRRAASRRS